MENEYNKILKELKDSIDSLKKNGISIEKLNKSYDNLEKHTSEIQKIEDNIDAIQSQVIDRIKVELDENKKAGKFSILGFWIGLIALVVSTYASIGNIRTNPLETEKKIGIINDRIENLSYRILGIDGHYQPLKKSFEVNQRTYTNTPILIKGKDTISINLSGVENIETDKEKYKLAAYLTIFINKRKVGTEGLSEIYQRNSTESYAFSTSNLAVQLFEKDTMRILNQSFIIKKIFAKNSRVNFVGDTKNAIILEKL
ncbi:MAG: hypothetical protein ABJK28_09285 [Algibacter sp.]